MEFVIPIRARNPENGNREHWAVKNKRRDSQRQAAMAKCPHWNEGPLLVIELTRVGPIELDDDGLRSSLKSIRDGIASRLRVDDGTKLVRWEYKQARGEYEVRVRIFRANDD